MSLFVHFNKKNFVKTLHSLSILLLVGMHQVFAIPQFAITQKVGSGGRLGDEIQMYAMAKWFAYKFQIPFYAASFKYSDSLNINNVEQCLTPALQSSFSQIIPIESEDELVKYLATTTVSTLFTVDARTYVHFSSKLVLNSSWPDGYINMYAHSREHPEFCAALKKALMPVKQINTLSFSNDTISVAVHVRKGSGDDTGVMSVQYTDEWEYILSQAVYNFNYFSGIDRYNPFRFPPEQFYVDQLLKLSVLFNHCPLSVYVFTDDKDPSKLVQRLKARVLLPNISFAYRQNAKNRADEQNSILEDLYDMAQFDCLIRPESGFSCAAQLISNHRIVIYPQAIRWLDATPLRQSMLCIDATAGIFYCPRTNDVAYVHFDEITQQLKEYAARLFSEKTL